MGIYELLVIDDSIRSILRGAFKADLVRNAARTAGMSRMQEDALGKLQAGVTTLEEVLRVVPIDALSSSSCDHCGHGLLPAFRFCPYCGIPRERGDSCSAAKHSLNVTDGVLSP